MFQVIENRIIVTRSKLLSSAFSHAVCRFVRFGWVRYIHAHFEHKYDLFAVHVLYIFLVLSEFVYRFCCKEKRPESAVITLCDGLCKKEAFSKNSLSYAKFYCSLFFVVMFALFSIKNFLHVSLVRHFYENTCFIYV